MIRLPLRVALAQRGQHRHWAYGALDAIGTGDVHEVLASKLNDRQRRTYAFLKASQGPAMAMTSRGILVDTLKRDEAVKELGAELRATVKRLNEHPVVKEVWDLTEKRTGRCDVSTRKDGKHTWEKGVPDTPARLCTSCGKSRMKLKPFNPGSPDQVKHLMYDLLKVKKQYNKDGLASTDEDALERMGRASPKYADITAAIIETRGLAKQIGFLVTKLTPGGRFKSSFNAGVAWTRRWTSHADPFGLGGNSQNIAERHRAMFIADPGKELYYADLKQAESNLVAHLAGDERYIEAHKIGDVHTYVTRLVWPEYPWTWDIAKDAKLAKSINPDWDLAPGHDIRFQSKRIQHGSNYGLTPMGIAMIAHIPVKAAAAAQKNYFSAFPGIRGWQNHIRELVREQKPIISILGFETKLFGRPWDEHTYKQGLSSDPQGTVADIIALVAWRIWQELDPDRTELLAQIHDALLGQVEAGDMDTLRRVYELMSIPVPVRDYRGVLRYTTIEPEIAVGRNWGHWHPERNPLGVKEVHFDGKA
jgi:hypothetical protein